MIGLAMVAHFKEWESQKDAMIDIIEKDNADYARIRSSRFSGRSLESMEGDLRTLRELDGIQRTAFENLFYELSHKPFFPLNTEEKKWMATARRELGDNNRTEETIKPPAATTPLPEFVTLNMDASVYDENKNEIRIPAGTKLKLLSHSEHDVTFRYNNGTYSLPAAITDFKKY